MNRLIAKLILFTEPGEDNLLKQMGQLYERLYKGAETREELIADPRFVSNLDRTNNEKELKVILDAEFKAKTIDEWMALLEEAGIPCAPINTVDRVVKDPQIIAREMIVEIEHPVAGKMHIPGVPIKMSATPGSVDTPAPLLGQHTDEILKEFGLSPAEIEELRVKKAI